MEVRLDATALGRVLADAHGKVSLTTTIPTATPGGRTRLSATGAGSGYTTTANVTIRTTR